MFLPDLRRLIRLPGTWAIYRALQQATYSRSPVHDYFVTLREHRRERVRSSFHVPRGLRKAVTISTLSALGVLLVILGPVQLIFGMYLLLVMFPFIILQLLLLALLMIGWLWPVWTIGDAARMISTVRARGIWGDFLLLPAERYQVALHSLGLEFIPYESFAGLFVVELFSLVAVPSVFYWPALAVIVGIEWLQLVAISVTTSIVLATRSHWNHYNLYAILSGAAIVLAHTLGGWAIVGFGSFYEDRPLAALFVGPPVMLVSSWPLGVSLGAAVAYLLALELVVRWLFAWCVAGLGEAS